MVTFGESGPWSDHEYETISPPSDREAAAPAAVTVSTEEAPPPVHVTHITDLAVKEDALTRSKLEQQQQKQQQPATLAVQAEARLLRIPLDNELIVPSAETPEPDSGADRVSTPDTQAAYLGTPTTTRSSRTEGISTSQVDSAALEHLPLKKESRKKKSENMDESEQPHGSKIQDKFKSQAGKLKTKIKNIKKPTFTIPNPKFKRPKFQKPKFERPKFQRPKFEAPKFTMPSMPSMPSMPKMPDRANIKFPSFNLPASMKRQRPVAERPISTTDTSAESKTNIFDFRTYPRIFDRTKKKAAASAPSIEETCATPEFATVPRAAARKKGPVGARWVHRFTDIQFADDESAKRASNGYNEELSSKDRGDSLERRMEADLRYEEALAEADEEMREYERENQNISRASPYNAERIAFTERWRHGSFRQPDDDDDEEIDLRQPREFGSNRDERSSVASSGHRGVIEEIDSDQFFLREKGISQDNIQVGLYLSSEIRDAFRQPTNALSQMDNREYDLDASDLSLARPSRPKRKHLKKTKRIKKTPHTSHEEISFDQESINTETEEYNKDAEEYKTYPPPRPTRNKRPKILAKEESLDMSQASSLPIDDEVNLNLQNLKSQEDLPSGVNSESFQGNIIGYVEKDEDISAEYNKYISDEALMYENEIMKNIEQPEIIISANQKYDVDPREVDRFLQRSGLTGTPKPPTRRHKSLKSLNLSEHDSIMGEFNKDKIMQDLLEQELNVYRIEHEHIEPSKRIPVAPVRRTRSRSRASSQPDDDRTSRGAESFVTEEEECIEQPCQRDIRDAMGYAVVDKSQRQKEPPLPTTPRRKRKSRLDDSSPGETKFFTVPRQLNDTPPMRPTRNYSTLGPNRPPRRRSETDLTVDEEKENIDISQYIEIEDEDHSRDLKSGDVVNKMKGRPLPAPPRPPRKTRGKSKEALSDITQQSNIIGDTINDYEKTLDISPASPIEAVEEITVSTQTDPLPDDFCCDEFVEEPTDRIVAPTRLKKSLSRDSSLPRTLERPKTPLERASSPHAMVIERRVHTPNEDETITHASLLVRPVPEYPRDSFVSKRFGADIPEMLPEQLISSPVVPQSDISEISSERSLLTESNSTLLPQSEETHFSEEPSILSTEAESITQILSTEESTLPYKSIQEEVTLEQVPEIPEKPQRRKSQVQLPQGGPQPQVIEKDREKHIPVSVTPGPDTEVGILRATRLQVTELDVEKLNVSELQANKILVSEIDGVSLQISELTSKSGNLVLNGLEISSGLIQEIIDRLQASSHQTQETPEQQQQEETHQHPPSMEQVATQTSIEDPEPIDSNKFTEPPATEQVATQTSIEIPDEQLKPMPITEQVATQTSIEVPDPEETILPEEYAELKRLQSLAFESTEDSFILQEFAELQAMPQEYTIPLEKARLPSPTILVDPPEPIAETEPEEEQDEEHVAIKQIKDRIRFIEEEMSEFISDFSPDEVTEMKSEINSIIDFTSEHVQPRSRDASPLKVKDTKQFTNDEINQIKSEVDAIIDTASEQLNRHVENMEHVSDFVELNQIYVPHWTPESIQTPDDMPGLTTDTLFLPGQVIFIEDDEDDYPMTPDEQAFLNLIQSQMVHDITETEPHLQEIHERMVTEDHAIIEQIKAQTIQPQPETLKTNNEQAETTTTLVREEEEIELTETQTPKQEITRLESEHTDTLFLPGQVIFEEDDEDDYPMTPDEQTFLNLIQSQMVHDITETEPHLQKTHERIVTEDHAVIKQIEAQTIQPQPETLKAENEQAETTSTLVREDEVELTEAQTPKQEITRLESQDTDTVSQDKKKLQINIKISHQDISEPTKTDGDSVVPKEFYELKSEQTEIMETFQKELTTDSQTIQPTKTEETVTSSVPPVDSLKFPDPQETIKHFEESKVAQEQRETSSSPVTPPRPPLPEPNLMEHVPQQPTPEMHPFPYYSEYIQSMPPPGFYTLRSPPHVHDLSEEDIPVHHRKRRYHRHLSRSRSSSDEDKRATSHSRRHHTRSPEPSIPQLTGQLARACTYSIGRVLRQIANAVSRHFGTLEGKHDFQIALVILLVLIAGLILLGFGGGQTVHLHHWEYFNPPKEL